MTLAYLIQGRWVVNTHGLMERGMLPVIRTEQGWETPEGEPVEALECQAEYDLSKDTEVIVQWGADDCNAPFLPDGGELERIGMKVEPLASEECNF